MPKAKTNANKTKKTSRKREVYYSLDLDSQFNVTIKVSV